MCSRLVPAALVAVLLAGCSSGGSAQTDEASAGKDTSLRAIETVMAEEQTASALELGSFAETSPGVRVAVASMGLGGDDAGPWVEVGVRVEAVDADGVVPSMWIVCGGNAEEGGWQAESTIDLGGAVPKGAFDEGVLNLLIPGDGRYGEPVPKCEAPAFVQAGDDAGVAVASWALDDALLDDLNAAGDAVNATL